jgi:hypothetical protein
MTLSVPRVRHYLQTFALEKMFIEELGWDHHSARLTVQVDGQTYPLTAFAEKRGVQIFECRPDAEGKLPDYATRRKIEKQVTKSAYEHLIIFMNADKTVQIWQWVSRQPGHPASYREHHYNPPHHSGDSLIQKLESITFTLNEEEGLTLTGVVFRLHDAFDRDRVTKKFYDYFKKEHGKFLDFIQGITEQGNCEWYASQRKGFLDGDVEYLKNRLKTVRERKGKDKFLTFYRYFLVRLFHEGFSQQPSQRTSDLEELLGNVPYLDGGLFELHELEEKYPYIDVPDKAFEQLFGFFDQYEWHLDTRPLSNDREINPDVLGYIFEKYINQKQMGAYYTKEDITGYISKNTIIPYLFDAAEKKCAIAFQPDSALWRLLRDDPDRYIYQAVLKGVVDENGEVIPLPEEIEKGIKDVSQRSGWNRPADPDYALPTEIWREHVARRQRCLDLREKLKAGEIHQINDLITYNLDIRQFVEDVITGSEGPELLRAFYKAISTITVLDPTCGSGAFLFAALNILEPLYEACLDRMQGFVDDLDRSGERHRPEKFSDFRNTLADIDRHPNRRYFILKSIIVNNLYGVDIMQEAVEICKLRLFLKLVAQVDKVKHLEPLPDIDFNIRAGNTLVGFATLEDVRQTLDGKLAFYKDQVDRIVEEAGIVELAFQRFHEMQIGRGMNAKEFAGAKKELRARLKKLTDELDQYLAVAYRINADKKEEFQQWRESHQPFHWFAEFYGILRTGGFDVIIGNPPYVEYRKVRDYSVRNYLTIHCKDLYAFVMERSVILMDSGGHLGMIVPVSIISTDGFEDLRAYLNKSLRFSWSIGFAERPSKLFTGVEKRLSIWLTCKKKDGVKSSFFSKYYRWLAEERENLFSSISFVPRQHDEQLVGTSIPKVADQLEINILLKLSAKKPLGAYLKRYTKDIVYYTRKVRYFVQFFDFIPEILDEKRRKILPSELKLLYCDSKLERDVIIAILNSSLFFWFYCAFSDVRNVNRREIVAFPCSIDGMDKAIAKSLQGKVQKLMHDFKSNSIWIKNEYKNHRKLSIQSFQPRLSKPIIDEIDTDLALHYGINDKELDFIKNFDLKYRIGH